MQLYKKQKIFSDFFFQHSSNLSEILSALKKVMTLIAYVFPKTQTAKDMVRQMF